MAIDYDHASTGLFTHVGKLIKHVNLLGTDASNLDSDLSELETLLQTGGQSQLLTSLRASLEGLKQSHIGARGQLARLADERIVDRDSVIEELGLATNSQREVLAELIRRMIADSETIDASVVTLGAVAAAVWNKGNGTVLTSKVLDGVSRPSRNIEAHEAYSGVNSELACSETMTLVCTGDSFSDRATSGEERFRWDGELPNAGPFDVETEGSGVGPQMQTLNAKTIVANRNFEDFTSNSPDSWTVDSGVAGTRVFGETGASNVYRGSKSLKFLGTASALATIQISQALSVSSLTPRRRYCCAFRWKASATDGGGVSFTVEFQGTGYTAASSEKYTIAGTSFPTSWTLASFFVNLPENLPSDWKLVIKATGTLGNGKAIYVDSLAFGEVEYHNGVACVVIAGSTPFVRGDRFTFDVTNDGAGTIQEFARRAWRCQLPSKTDGSETIADSLAS